MSKRKEAPRLSAFGGSGDEPAAYIPPPVSKAKRDRSWERAHNHTVVTYRGIPQELKLAIVKLAQEYNVPVGDIARLFLEHGLATHREGNLPIAPHPITGKLGLYED